MTIEEYINSPNPIEKELGMLFSKGASLNIFDVGGCEAEDSIRYANLFPNSTIFTFEPLPENFNKCQANVAKYQKANIYLFQLALAANRGKAAFYVSSGIPDGVDANEWNFGNKSSSLLPPNSEIKIQKWLKFNKIIEVEKETISSFCNQKHIETIDFMHLDVQGAELDVLAGAKELLSKTKAIWLEVETVQLYVGQPLNTDVEKYMKNNRFVKIVDTVCDISGDQLYINKNCFNVFRFSIMRIWFTDVIKRKARIVAATLPKNVKNTLKKIFHVFFK